MQFSRFAVAAVDGASFSGPMRRNLIAMLDSIGVNRLLDLQSSASLWEDDAHLTQFTSERLNLRCPVGVRTDVIRPMRSRAAEYRR